MKECKSIKCFRVLSIVPGNKPALSRFFCDVCYVSRNSWRLPVVNKETLKVFLQEVVLSSEGKCWLLFVFKVFLTRPSLGGEILGGFYISSWSISDIFIMSIYFIYDQKKSFYLKRIGTIIVAIHGDSSLTTVIRMNYSP